MRAVSDRERALTTLDSALLSAVVAEDVSSQEAKAAQLFTAGLDTIGAEVVSATYRQTGDELHGTVRLRMPTSLLSVLGLTEIEVTVASAAKKSTPAPAAPCIIVLDPTRVQSLLVNSGARLVAPQCELHVHGTTAPSAIFNAASEITTARICMRGTNIIDNGGVHPNKELGCNPSADPYAALLPPDPGYTCTRPGDNYNGGDITLSPGVYCGWHNFNSTTNVTFQPGFMSSSRAVGT